MWARATLTARQLSLATLQVLVSNPFEAIKVRLQLQGACSDAWSLLGELGLQGLYRGWQGCAARDVTFSAL